MGLLNTVWGSFFVGCVGFVLVAVAKRWLRRERSAYEREFGESPSRTMTRDVWMFLRTGQAPFEGPICLWFLGWLLGLLGLLRFLSLGGPGGAP